VDARPEDRRALIDEAAGITRYKAQKKEAERKIESTLQNLTHISAVMAETKRQINVLTRAAGKAARYKELQAELRSLDLALARWEDGLLAERQTDRLAEKARDETRLTGLLTGLDRLEIDLEESRLAILAREKDADDRNAALYQLQNEYDGLKREDDYLHQRMDADRIRQERLAGELERLAGQKQAHMADLDRLQEEMASGGSVLAEKKAHREALRAEFKDIKDEYDQSDRARTDLAQRRSQLIRETARIQEILAGHDRQAQSHEDQRDEILAEGESLAEEAGGLDETILRLTRDRDDSEELLDEIRGRASETRRERETLREEAERLSREERRIESDLNKTGSRLSALEDIRAQYAGYSDGVKALMADPGFRSAGLLGPVAEYVRVPEGYEAALEAALGERLGFLAAANKDAVGRAIAFLKEKKLGRCGFVLADRAAAGTVPDLTRTLIGDPVLADTLDQGLALAGQGRSVLTREGDYFGADGLMVGGGRKAGEAGPLQRLREMERLRDQAAALEDEKDRLALLVQQARDAADERSEHLRSLEEEDRVVQRRRIETEKELSAVSARRKEIENRRSRMARALENHAALVQKLEAEREAALIRQEELENENFDLDSEIEAAEEEVRVLARELETVRERGQAASLELNSLEERLATARREHDRLAAWLADTQNQTVAKEREIGEAKASVAEMDLRREAIGRNLEGYDGRIEAARAALDQAKKVLDQSRIRANELENETRAARREREQTQERLRKLELDLQEIDFRRRDLFTRIQNDYELDLTDLPEADRPPLPGDFDPEKAGRTRKDAKEKIAALGEVNLTAIGEHDALMERYQFYRDQYDDLERAIANLKDSIHKINRTCRIRFKSTFEAVDQKLREIFPLLFEGGEAWLSLTDENDILDSGVEIHVHPPGKKLTVMSLLSGGEKALVALALIFALYLIKPSPFCMLDETDAPLDEANIDRFNRLLKKLGQSSQIIMVTHNKRTMQISETLYGVTMEEPGVSKMVSVNLSELEALEEHVPMVQAG
jgi:chromosome segregation protein